MIGIVVAIILLAFNAVLGVLAARYNLQALQQSGYKGNEFFAWLGSTWMRQDILILTAVLGLLSVATGLNVLAIICLLITVFAIYYFNFLRTYRTKKPLVWTARAKRIALTDAIVCVVIAVVVTLLAGIKGTAGAAAVLALAQMLVVPIANLVNSPFERANNNRYIQEARGILQACPDLRIVGITGSYGKTSVKHFLAELMRERYEVLATPGNYNTTLGVVRTIRERLKPTHEVFLCEMGARYKGDIAEICDLVHPDAGIITAIGPQHLESFGSIEGVIETKFELADAVQNEEEGASNLVLNGDNEHILTKAAEYDGAILYGSGEGCDYRVSGIKTSREGTAFTVHAPDGQACEFSTRLVGRHNVENIVGAIAVAHRMGVPLDGMRVPLRRLSPVEHRLSMTTSGSTTVIDDAYNSNPIGSQAALDVLALMEGAKVLVTPGMIELGSEQAAYNASFGEAAAGVCDYIVIVGRTNREALLEGIARTPFDEGRVRLFDGVQEALAFAHSIEAPDGKAILIENDLPDIY